MSETRFAIIGGGIVGASIAYHLSDQTDATITLYDRTTLASETTFKSTSMIGTGGPRPYHRMKAYGFRLYNEFFADPVADARYRQSGRLRVTTSARTARAFERLVGDDSNGVDAEEISSLDTSRFENCLVEYVPSNKLRESLLVPPLETEMLEGALYRPQFGYIYSDSRTLGPRELAFEFIKRARDNGAIFETDTEVKKIVTDGDTVTGIETNRTGFVDVNEVVCAAGPWSPELVETAGIDIPVEHTISSVFALELENPLSYTLPAIKLHEASIGLHAKQDDTVLVTYTPNDCDTTSQFDSTPKNGQIPAEHRQTALQWAERLVPQLQSAELIDEWVGRGTRTPDGYPIVGWTALDGLSLGVTMAGIQLAPAVGSIVSRQLIEGDPTANYNTVSISRFANHTDSYSGGGANN